MLSSSRVMCVSVRVLALVLALHSGVWGGFAGPLLAKAEGVPGVPGAGGLPGEGCDTHRSRLWSFKINLCHCCCALEPFLKAAVRVAVGECGQSANFSGFSPVSREPRGKGMSQPTLGLPRDFGK